MVEPSGRRADRTVLLVDDDAPFVALIERHLQAHGYKVESAGSVAETQRLLKAGLRPGLVVLDINLPDDSGWSLLRDGDLAAAGSPPVVIMSGTQIRPERLRQFAVAGYLPKPVSMSLLTSCVERYIDEPGAPTPADSSEVLE
ncbi:MAG TPA: response regulator [Candidatus Limnocylindrales bacterium]